MNKAELLVLIAECTDWNERVDASELADSILERLASSSTASVSEPEDDDEYPETESSRLAAKNATTHFHLLRIVMEWRRHNELKSSLRAAYHWLRETGMSAESLDGDKPIKLSTSVSEPDNSQTVALSAEQDRAVWRLERDSKESESKDNGTCIVYAEDVRTVLAALSAPTNKEPKCTCGVCAECNWARSHE